LHGTDGETRHRLSMAMCNRSIARERAELAHTNHWKILVFCLSRKQNQKAPHGGYWIRLQNRVTDSCNYLEVSSTWDAILVNGYIKICLEFSGIF